MSGERNEIGEVLSIEGRSARVKMKRSSRCASCSCAGLCSPFGKEWMLITADNPIGATAGQTVRITYRVEGEAKASFILYIVPVLALLTGALLGAAIGLFENPDLSAIAVGLAFLIVSFGLIRMYAARRYGRDPSYHPVISEVLDNYEEATPFPEP